MSSLLPTSLDPGLIVPILTLALPVIYFVNKFYTTYQEKKALKAKGIGRGVPGFLTSVKKVKIPQDIADRIRAGEEVSASEITEALEEERLRILKEEEDEAARVEEAARAAERESRRRKGDPKPIKVPDTVDTEWLPAGTLGESAIGKSRRRK